MGGRLSKCQICSKVGCKGIYCSSNHFYCTSCLSSYVTKSCESTAALCEKGFVIRCPIVNCTAKPWASNELRTVLQEPTLTKYLDTLVKLSTSKSQKSIVKFRKIVLGNKITQLMKLACPNCNTVYDKQPGGSCAVMCFNCGTHFCWLCFKSSFNLKSCQAHVTSCSQNKWKALNPPSHTISAAHKHYRVLAIQELIKGVRQEYVQNNLTTDSLLSNTCITCLTSSSSTSDGNEAATMAADELIDSVLIEKAALLKENNIDYQDIYS